MSQEPDQVPNKGKAKSKLQLLPNFLTDRVNVLFMCLIIKVFTVLVWCPLSGWHVVLTSTFNCSVNFENLYFEFIRLASLKKKKGTQQYLGALSALGQSFYCNLYLHLLFIVQLFVQQAIRFIVRWSSFHIYTNDLWHLKPKIRLV